MAASHAVVGSGPGLLSLQLGHFEEKKKSGQYFGHVPLYVFKIQSDMALQTWIRRHSLLIRLVFSLKLI
jgi:hypothetical protein